MSTTRTGSGPYSWARFDVEPDPFAREPQPRQARSDAVDPRTTDDLTSALRHLADSVGAPGISRPERLARAELLADSLAHVRDALPVLSPYAHRGSRLADEYRAHNPAVHTGKAEAAARIEADRHATRAWADLSALLGYGHVHPSGVTAPASTGLLAYAGPAGPIGPASLSTIPVLSAAGLPVAYLDVDPGTAMDYLSLDVEAGTAAWHMAAFPLNLARQVADWTEAGQAELERLVTVAVNARLESAILADLTTGAPTAASLDAAETAAVTAWPAGTAAVIHHPGDTPALRAAYPAAGVPAPTLIASTGQTPGTAHVVALDGIHLEASPLEYLAVDEPKLLGRAISVYRYGRALVRAAGAVQKVVL